MNENKLNSNEWFTLDHDDWFSSVIEKSSALISRFLPDSTITYANQTFCKYFNITKEKLIGRKWFDLLSDNNKTRVQTIISSFNPTMEPNNVQIELLLPDSTVRIFNWESSPVKDKNGKFIGEYQSIGTDITEQKLIITVLENTERRLKEINISKDKFISIIAHDLRSPFQGLLGISKLLIDDSDLTMEEHLMLENKLYNALKNQFNLLDSLLMWSRVQHGAIEYKPEKNNLISDIEELVLTLNPTINKKNLTLKTNLPQSLFAYYDRNMISTVLRNMISNAIKFTNQFGNLIITATSNENEVICSIKDDGIGISEENIKDLFRIDVPHSSHGTDNESGSGFGLIICNELIEKNHGRIWVESKLGEGSVFSFSVPINCNS